MEVPRSVLVLAKREIILNADQIGHINQVIMETFNNAHNVSFKGSSCIEFTIAMLESEKFKLDCSDFLERLRLDPADWKLFLQVI